MVARGNCGLSGESITASLMHLLVLVHLRILNWLVVNSPTPGLWNKGLSRTYTEILTVILKYRRTEWDTMRYNAIETKTQGTNGLPTLNGQSEPFHSEFFNSK